MVDGFGFARGVCMMRESEITLSRKFLVGRIKNRVYLAEEPDWCKPGFN